MMKRQSRVALLSRVMFHIAGMYCFNQISYRVYLECRLSVVRAMLPEQSKIAWPN
jgi:hypothetical protein